MRIFALNCGSSSIKGAVIDSSRQQRLLDIRVDSVEAALEQLRAHQDELGPPEAIVHRIVHGGERFLQITRIDDAVLAEIEKLNPLAPLHNPPAVAAVRLTRQAYPQVPQLAAFDTAFHATLPQHAREYALPLAVSGKFGLRRYGFHGISHGHVLDTVVTYLDARPDELRIVSCHLGNGASVAAIERGRSVDTSMGMTPLEGLVMGTRAGDLDPGVPLTLLRSGAFDAGTLDTLLNKQSGMVGLTGTNDMRDIERRALAGDEDCRLALAVYAHRVRKYIGAYAAIMGGVDVVAFTGGVGENSATIRQRCLQKLEFLGAELDDARNRGVQSSGTACSEISTAGSRTRLLVVRADEELAMAMDAATAISNS
jgi:acetate kinase